VGRTLPSASSGQALSVAFDVDFDLASDVALDVAFDLELMGPPRAASTTAEERRFSAA
jgi:hypothetical protein